MPPRPRPPCRARDPGRSATAALVLGCLLATAGCQQSGSSRRAAWQRLATGPQPPARHDASLAVGHDQRRIYLFGGRAQQDCLADLWAFEPGADRWQRLAADGPAPRSGAGLAWDPDGRRLILFGGYCHDRLGNPRFYNELWFYDADGGWRREYLRGGPGPRAWHAQLVWDGRLVVFGGVAPAPGYHRRDVWALDLEKLSWSRLATDGGPRMAGRPVMVALDERAGRFAVLGRNGVLQPDPPGAWVLDVAADRWRAPVATAAEQQPAVDYCAAAARPGGRLLVLAGPDPDRDRSGWVAWTSPPPPEVAWRSQRLRDGPEQPTGMACAAEPDRASWMCFGGADRQRLGDATWRLDLGPQPSPGDDP